MDNTPRMQPDGSTTVKYRPVLPHTFGRGEIAHMTRAEKRAYARSLRKRGRPYLLEPNRVHKVQE